MEAAANHSQEAYFKGSAIKEYLLVVDPEAGVWQRVMEEKVRFCKEYTEAVAIETRPHIRVANFLAKEEMEEVLLRWMHRVISTHKSFTVTLNNYSGLPGGNAIYLRVQDHLPFRQLAKELKVIDELVRSSGLPQAELVCNPHLPIAGRMAPSVYGKAMPDYSRKEFHAAFEVKELVLLKRLHQFDSCRQVSVFRLQP